MQLLVVNYHYIGPEGQYPYPGIYPTTLERFRQQLATLGSYFSFVGQDDILGALRGEKTLPERSCLITFDDGFRSQYELALPILDELRIPALFFLNGLPYAEQRAVVIHKIHYCRANYAPADFTAQFEKYYAREVGKPFRMDDFETPDTSNRQYHRYDEPDVARFKHILNKLLPEELKERIIAPMFRDLVSGEARFVGEFYLDPEQARELWRRNYLGTHTLSHKGLSGLSDREVDFEIRAGLEALKKVGIERVRALSYPYGSSAEFSLSIVSAVAANGIELGFTMERTFNTTLRNPLLLARLDTNDAPGGKNPYFEIAEGKIRVTNPVFNLHRTLYFDESVGESA